MNDFYTYSSMPINGVMQPVYEAPGIRPGAAIQPVYKGRGTGSPPSISNYANSFDPYAGGGSAGFNDMASGSGSGNGPANMGQADIAASDPYNLVESPVLWACIFLVVGLLGLRYVIFRG
jgi:hypothetical protein